MIQLILFALLLHWIGDFVCQPTTMVKRKLESNQMLAWHVAIYSAWMLFIFVPVQHLMVLDQIAIATSSFVLVAGIAHLLIDYLTIRTVNYFENRGSEYGVALTISTDQLLHTVTLILLIVGIFGHYL